MNSFAISLKIIYFLLCQTFITLAARIGVIRNRNLLHDATQLLDTLPMHVWQYIKTRHWQYFHFKQLSAMYFDALMKCLSRVLR